MEGRGNDNGRKGCVTELHPDQDRKSGMTGYHSSTFNLDPRQGRQGVPPMPLPAGYISSERQKVILAGILEGLAVELGLFLPILSQPEDCRMSRGYQARRGSLYSCSIIRIGPSARSAS
jgi:hypothetical protein